MSELLNDPAALDALNQLFSDLIALADFEAQLPRLRPDVKTLPLGALHLGGLG